MRIAALALRPLVLLLAIASLLGALPLAAQTDGNFDPDFGGGDGVTSWNGGGIVDVEDLVATDSLLIGLGSFQQLAPGSPLHLHWQAFDTVGSAVASRACYVDTGTLVTFGVASRAHAGLVDSSGRLWIGGAVTILGSEDQTRALLARFDLGQNGCVLDDTFSSNGWDLLDEETSCDTLDCEVVGLAEIRRETGAVLASRYVALLAVRVNLLVTRYFLVSFDEGGSLITSFGVNGYRELVAPDVDDFAGAAYLEVDPLGRPCVYATAYDADAPSLDLDVYGFRYTVDGDLDTNFYSSGFHNFLDNDDSDIFARDFVVRPDGDWAMSAEPPAGNLYVHNQDVDGGGAFAIFTDPDRSPTQVLGQGNGMLVLVSDHHPNTATDGFRSERRMGLGVVVDTSWGAGGGRNYDVDFGGNNSDTVVEAILWHGRLVVAGKASNPTGRSGFLLRAENHHVFADGFEAGSAAAWSEGIGLSDIP